MSDLSAGGTVALIARREIVERTRERAFKISTGITLLVVVGVIVAIKVFGGGPTTYDVGVGPGQQAVADAMVAQVAQTDTEIELTELPNAAAAEKQLDDGDLDLALVDGKLVVNKDLSGDLRSLASYASQQVQAQQTLGDAGVDGATIGKALSPTPPTVQTLQEVDPDSDARQAVAFIAVILLYGQLISYGITVANGVVEEKSTRVVEILLATVRPRRLLAGKVLGVGAIGLAQLLLIAAVGIGTGLATGAFSLGGGVLGIIAQVLVWFVLGYTFYAVLYAAGGATVSRQEDLPNATNLLTFLVVGSFFAAIYASNAADSTVATVLSYVPPFSALVMPIRYAAGDSAWWEVLVSMGLLVVVTAALLSLAARIYENAVLRTGAPTGWRKALRSTSD